MSGVVQLSLQQLVLVISSSGGCAMSFMGMGCLGSDPNKPFFNGRKIKSKNDLSSIWTHLRKYIFKAEVIASWDMHEEP